MSDRTLESPGRGLAVVTGASSGIGLELARILAADGFDPVLVARRTGLLEELASEIARDTGIRPRVVGLDLAEPEATDRLLAELGEDTDRVTYLVNNAGFGVLRRFDGVPADRIVSMINLNVVTLTTLTRALLPGMIRRGQGRVLNVASTAAFLPGPRMSVYYATKAYVLSFSVALHRELRGTGVTVTSLQPGPTRTEFQATAGLSGSSPIERFAMADSRSVALAGHRGAMSGKSMVTPGLFNKATAVAARIVPRPLAAAIVGSIQRSSGQDES